MTSSTGTSGLILAGSPPSAMIASRIDARSTTAGTPVRSCIRTRAGVKAISRGVVARGLAVARGRLAPARERLDVRGGDLDAVLVAQQVLQAAP